MTGQDDFDQLGPVDFDEIDNPIDHAEWSSGFTDGHADCGDRGVVRLMTGKSRIYISAYREGWNLRCEEQGNPDAHWDEEGEW